MHRSSLMVISLIVFVVGLFILFNSVAWGQGSANAYLRSQGGGMDATQFMIVLQEFITVYRWFGGILSLISGFTVVRAIDLK